MASFLSGNKSEGAWKTIASLCLSFLANLGFNIEIELYER